MAPSSSNAPSASPPRFLPREALASALLLTALLLQPATSATGWKDLGNARLAAYFDSRVTTLEHALSGVASAEEWRQSLPERRRQLRDMLGLEPLPERTPLQATITRTLEREDFRVENLHFQSRPGLYVTANLFLPKNLPGKLPAILYVCGHGQVKIDGVSYGNKASYHHHGVWFARNGYACLIIDTLQLGEIEGIHHGTYRYDRWWWQARGYTPAGVEAWNGMRALDYLASRPEVDPERLGVTGRSGGGAYSWYLAALDERIQCAVPVAGITSLRNHLVDGCIEGHCDCMFPVNTYRWDFDQLAALVAPRPLLISNTDKDSIFPVEGVFQVFLGARHVYGRLGSGARLGFNLEEGPHKDTQPLQTAAFHWMNRHLRGTALTDSFSLAAAKVLEPRDLKVFATLPADERNTRIDESFVPAAAPPTPPVSASRWQEQSAAWRTQLRERCFRGWPQPAPAPQLRETFAGEKDGVGFSRRELTSEPGVSCALYLLSPAAKEPDGLRGLVLHALDQPEWQDFLSFAPSLFPEVFPGQTLPSPGAERLARERDRLRGENRVHAYFCPRGTGPDVWPDDPKKLGQIRRRFALLGQTVDGMRTWDVLQAILALRAAGFAHLPLHLQASGTMAGNALYASLFTGPAVQGLDLQDLPGSHRDGPIYLNVLRVLDMPQAVALAADRSPVRLANTSPEAWPFVTAAAQALGWEPGRFQAIAP